MKTYNIIYSKILILILLISLTFACKSSNKIKFEFYTSDISTCRLNIFNSIDRLNVKIISDKKFKETKRIRRNEILININEKNIDKLITSIQHECTISCKKILSQSDLPSDLKNQNVELLLSIKFSK